MFKVLITLTIVMTAFLITLCLVAIVMGTIAYILKLENFNILKKIDFFQVIYLHVF